MIGFLLTCLFSPLGILSAVALGWWVAERIDRHRRKDARLTALREALSLAEGCGQEAELEIGCAVRDGSSEDVERAMLNHAFTLATVKYLEAEIAGESERARSIQRGQQAIVNALVGTHVERRLAARPFRVQLAEALPDPMEMMATAAGN